MKKASLLWCWDLLLVVFIIIPLKRTMFHCHYFKRAYNWTEHARTCLQSSSTELVIRVDSRTHNMTQILNIKSHSTPSVGVVTYILIHYMIWSKYKSVSYSVQQNCVFTFVTSIPWFPSTMGLWAISQPSMKEIRGRPLVYVYNYNLKWNLLQFNCLFLLMFNLLSSGTACSLS